MDISDRVVVLDADRRLLEIIMTQCTRMNGIVQNMVARGAQASDADVKAIEARSDLFSGVTPLVELHGTVRL